jgi:glycosyltransferase involved in cell wall biosynthesis
MGWLGCGAAVIVAPHEHGGNHMTTNLLLILIAPNVSEQMGGEAIKALQSFQELKKLHPDTLQITHARNRAEVARLGLKDVFFVEDSALALFLWRSVVLRMLINVWFGVFAIRLAEQIAADRRHQGRVVIHQVEPNSPVVPRFLSTRHTNVFGPINGNIYYPPIFRAHESLSAKLRRITHLPLQRLNRWRPGGLKRADQILVAGGERSLVSLRAAGCPETILQETLDCGIKDELLDRPRITHEGVNLRFIHFGRLVFHKGTRLIVESLVKTSNRVCLDIVGRGPELESCRVLVKQLGLEDRVRFLDWYASQSDLFKSFSDYRGVVLPSIEDANGIVIQEAMAVGLPPVCLDWGGPALLIDHERTGFLIAPTSVEHITTGIAECLDRLATDHALAESMSKAARAAATEWRWSELAARWLAGYPSR